MRRSRSIESLTSGAAGGLWFGFVAAPASGGLKVSGFETDGPVVGVAGEAADSGRCATPLASVEVGALGGLIFRRNAW
jgi:hypothetical protein